jgi:hypothetical protein
MRRGSPVVTPTRVADVDPVLQRPEDITAEFLSSVLGRDVDGFTAQPVGTGQMADSVRYTLSPVGPDPASVVVKFAAADDTSRATGHALRSYEIEVRFYKEIASTVGIRTPDCHYAAVDPDTGWFTLVLEDLAPAVQGDQMAGCSVDQAALALEELTKLHAPRWADDELTKLDWLHRSEQGPGIAMILGSLFAGFVDRYEERLDPAHLQLARQLVASAPYLMSQRTGPICLTHGDYRLDNMLFGTAAGGPPLAVVDWQTTTTGPPLSDASYFVGAGLQVEERRANEEELIREYHRGLLAAGVEGFDWDTCWSDYRQYSFGGLIMAIVASMLVERTPRGDDMFMTMASRHSTQALDLGADEFLVSS